MKTLWVLLLWFVLVGAGSTGTQPPGSTGSQPGGNTSQPPGGNTSQPEGGGTNQAPGGGTNQYQGPTQDTGKGPIQNTGPREFTGSGPKEFPGQGSEDFTGPRRDTGIPDQVGGTRPIKDNTTLYMVGGLAFILGVLVGRQSKKEPREYNGKKGGSL